MSLCAGRPWQRQQERGLPQGQQGSAAAATYSEYDEGEGDDEPSARKPPEPDYADPERAYAAEPERVYAEPEQNYEVDEAVSVLSDGRAHGVQPQRAAAVQSTTTTTTESATGDDDDGGGGFVGGRRTAANTPRKSGYVVDGKHYRKYRVEEETADGFIVGEYGVVSHHDGNTRGVRYTADSSINPRVIYEALAKFLALR